jgi:hypothetical protein
MSQNQHTPPAQKPQSDDPLASLHRMSTTAGAASQEYVAINLPAVATLLLGLASISVVMGDTLLVLPILAVLCGVVALRQIGNSNGTQTGRLMTVLGMLIAVGMAGFIAVREVQARRAVAAEEGKIYAAVDDFGKVLVAKDYDRAAAMFAPGFFERKKLSKDQVKARWQQILSNQLYGDLQSVETNGRVQLLGSPGESRGAETMMVFRFSKTDAPMRRGTVLKKDDSGRWLVDDVPELFPPPPPADPTPASGNPAMMPGSPGMMPR